ncbi:uncharacterized protein RCC_03120 [Ramularia collo-cygni]|uniref:Uncharacterized protein n=1 Tax=Ramularia collo-cygni TaxID=112498 RepID=A0A2D3V184_9PEZI|nr:uncharacterized protein RCC_03120 [Ramularia collo-cygni]CZT17286.1 uncharacterized protein RCC_03120 [Ramularia collo-cygni]
MSLAILPSTPMVHTSSHRQHASPKRPKLSLNTANVPSSFGKKSTSLRLDTLSTTSPTSRNTFRNATLPTQGTTGLKTQQPPLADLAIDTSQEQQERHPSPTDTATSNDSASSASSIESTSGEVPYRLSRSLTSILKNGPLPHSPRQKTSFAQSKPAMFPPAKKVAFRTPLEEEVITKKYTLRHIDIASSTSTISTLELSPTKKEAGPCDSPKEDDLKPSKSVDVATTKKLSGPQPGEKRESSDEEDSDTAASTPVAGRRKRSRRWVWTLPHAAPSSHEDDRTRRNETVRA